MSSPHAHAGVPPAGVHPLRRFAALAAGVFLAAALLAPVWLVRYPPLLDYPNHLARAFVLAHLRDPVFHFQAFYAADWGAAPYLVQDLLLVGLQRIVSADVAGRLVLSLSLLGVPLAGWFFARRANLQNELLAVVSLLAAYNLFFLYGFANQQLGLAVFLVFLGLWLGWLERPRWARWWLALLAATLLYFTHWLAFAVAGLVVTAHCAFRRARWREWLVSWLMFAPGAALFLLWRRAAAVPPGIEFRPWSEKLPALAEAFQGYASWLDWVVLLGLVAGGLAARCRNAEFRWQKAWPAVVALLFALYWVCPLSTGLGWPLDQRIIPFALVLLPAVAQVGRRARLLAGLALVLFAAQLAEVAVHFAGAQRELAQLARAVDAIPSGARVLPIVEARDEPPSQRPYAHFWAYGVIRRGWFAPYMFAMHGIVPLRLRLQLYAPEGFWDLDYTEPPEWASIAADYDYVWAFNVNRFAGDLNEIGEVIFEEADLRVYQLKKPPAP